MTAKPYATVRASKLAETTKPLEWLVDGLFIRGGAAILGGPPKAGKSFLALDLCVAVASATCGAGHFRVAAASPVLLLAAEDPEPVLMERLQSLARVRGTTLEHLPIDVIVERELRLPEGLPRLAATLDLHRPGLLLLDPLIRLHGQEENSSTEMSVVLDGLRHLARSYMTTVLVVHHARKAPSGAFAGAGLRGSSDIAAFGDVNVYMRKLTTKGSLELRVEHRAMASPDPLRLKLTTTEGKNATARFDPLDKPHDPLEGKVLSILDAAAGPVSSAFIREKLGVRNQVVASTLGALVADGRAHRQGRDGWVLVAPST